MMNAVLPTPVAARGSRGLRQSEQPARLQHARAPRALQPRVTNQPERRELEHDAVRSSSRRTRSNVRVEGVGKWTPEAIPHGELSVPLIPARSRWHERQDTRWRHCDIRTWHEVCADRTARRHRGRGDASTWRRWSLAAHLAQLLNRRSNAAVRALGSTGLSLGSPGRVSWRLAGRATTCRQPG
jgi:predicted secreted protein